MGIKLGILKNATFVRNKFYLLRFKSSQVDKIKSL
jgi:hypothetical protein